jgi:hypothetical protein
MLIRSRIFGTLRGGGDLKSDRSTLGGGRKTLWPTVEATLTRGF